MTTRFQRLRHSGRVLLLASLSGAALMISLTLSSVSGAGGAVDESAGGDQVLHPTQQSPINLPARPPSRTQHEVDFEYSDTAEHLIRRDHTIEMEYDPGSKVEFDGRQYQLEQFHFHTPSEHLIAQRRFPVELHLVHHSKDGQALVLGILFEVGPPNAFIEQILLDAPRGIGRIDLESHLDVSKLLPDEKHFYSYLGSLTTAPYTEGIQWLILSEHPHVSPEQVVRLLVLEGGNARDVQPIGDRSIEGS